MNSTIKKVYKWIDSLDGEDQYHLLASLIIDHILEYKDIHFFEDDEFPTWVATGEVVP